MSWGKLPTSGADVVATNPDFDTIRVGDVVGGDYMQIDTDGSIRSFGDATHWDDLRVSIDTTSAVGSNPPTKAIFKDNGETIVGTNSALSFISSSQGNLTLPYNVLFDTSADYTFEMWFRPTVATRNYIELVRKRNCFTLEFWGNDSIYLNVPNMGSTLSSVDFNRGSWNHVAIVQETGSPNVVRMYLNGQERGVITSYGEPVEDTQHFVFNRQETIYDLDYVAYWSKALNTSEILVRYNAGIGLNLTGFETSLEGLWELNDGSAAVAVEKTGNSSDGAITGGSEGSSWDWIDGHVGNNSPGSRGVVLSYFSPETINEVFFTAQMPHAWAVGTAIHPHVHYVPKGDGGVGDRIRWGLEYTWSDITETFGDTTIIYGNNNSGNDDLLANKHLLSELGIIDGTGHTLSSMLVCRVFRDSENSLDTFDDFAALLEVDFHYEIDSNGSRQEYIK